MSNRFDDLKALLRTLFQLDQPDLDFGIYRIMHAKSGEITRFLDNDLLPQVRTAFEQYQPADKAALNKELNDVIANVKEAGMDPEASPKVKELREQLKAGVDINALEAEVYDHLYSFFRRYYSEGDFLSRRVYKPGVYAIPYEGEEVKLHWANADQYYIKTSEYLRDYAFRLKPESDRDPMRVHFRLVDAAEGEHGNVKAAEGKGRVFILTQDDPVAIESGELIIRFEYRPATLDDWTADEKNKASASAAKKPPDQKALLAIAARRILATGGEDLVRWITELDKKHNKADGSQADYNRLTAHLNRYAARNTFDYFIHKNLGDFLRRELDFYIKNEVMRLDDIEKETAPRVEQYLSKIRVIRKIASKIIDFLAQLEDFQKKLWLKKKFVTETFYCIRVGVIPEEFYEEIAANDGQRQEWVELLKIDTIKKDLTTPGYSDPLTTEFLKAHPTLMIDTRHFDEKLVARLLEALGDIDEQTDGVLIHSENYQALSVMAARYRASFELVYIDPPYNTEYDRASGKFVYKDNYEHSSWLSLINDRLNLDKLLLTATAAHFVSSDESELHRLIALNERFGRKYHGLLTWRRTRTGGHLSRSFNQLSDYVVVTTQPEGQYLFGGQADPDESQPMTKATNLRKKLEFPPGSIRFLDEESGSLEIGHEGTSENPVRVVCGSAIKDHTNNGTVTLDGPFVWTQLKLRSELENGARVIVKKIANLNPRFYRKPTQHKPLPSLADNSFSVGTNEDGSGAIADLFCEPPDVSYPKPVELLERLIESKAHFTTSLTLLDYFGGSGTTGHAAIALNRKRRIRTRFVLVELGDSFETVLLPRLLKVTYAPEWREGAPSRLPSAEEVDHSPRIMRVVRLESYEDTLNNLGLVKPMDAEPLLESAARDEASELAEQYTLRYMLDVETRGSQSLLNILDFVDPTAYRLKVKTPGSDESREACVDLIETFNWLIGLKVQHIAAPQMLDAKTKRDSESRLVLDGRLTPTEADADGAWWFRTVTGTAPGGEKVLIIWRKQPATIARGPEGAEEDSLILNEWFTKQGYSTRDFEFDIVYVNGDNNLENLKRPDDTWKVRLIEEDFHRLMFDEGSV